MAVLVCVVVVVLGVGWGVGLIGLEEDYPQGAEGISTLRTYKHLSKEPCVCVCMHTVLCFSVYTPT